METISLLVYFFLLIGLLGLGFGAILRGQPGMARFARWYFGGAVHLVGRAVGGTLRWIASWFDGRR